MLIARHWKLVVEDSKKKHEERTQPKDKAMEIYSKEFVAAIKQSLENWQFSKTHMTVTELATLMHIAGWNTVTQDLLWSFMDNDANFKSKYKISGLGTIVKAEPPTKIQLAEAAIEAVKKARQEKYDAALVIQGDGGRVTHENNCDTKLYQKYDTILNNIASDNAWLAGANAILKIMK